MLRIRQPGAHPSFPARLQPTCGLNQPVSASSSTRRGWEQVLGGRIVLRVGWDRAVPGPSASIPRFLLLRTRAGLALTRYLPFGWSC